MVMTSVVRLDTPACAIFASAITYPWSFFLELYD